MQSHSEKLGFRASTYVFLEGISSQPQNSAQVVQIKLFILYLPRDLTLGFSCQCNHFVPTAVQKKAFPLNGWANVRIKITHSGDEVWEGQVRQSSFLQVPVFMEDPLLISRRNRRECVNATGRHRKHLESTFPNCTRVSMNGLQKAVTWVLSLEPNRRAKGSKSATPAPKLC